MFAAAQPAFLSNHFTESRLTDNFIYVFLCRSKQQSLPHHFAQNSDHFSRIFQVPSFNRRNTIKFENSNQGMNDHSILICLTKNS